MKTSVETYSLDKHWLALAGVCMFRFISGAGEFYACCIYPAVSGCLSRLAPLVSFSLVKLIIGWSAGPLTCRLWQA